MKSALGRSIGSFLSNWTVRIVTDQASALPGELLWSDPTGTVVFRLPDGRVEIVLVGILSVRLDLYAESAEIAPLSPEATPQTIRHFWVAQVVPRLIASERCLVLHGAVLQNGGRSVVFLGPSGAGKSTLAAGLSRSGWSLAGDDAALITMQDNRWIGGAVDSSLRLRTDSADALIGNSASMEPVASYSAKRRVLVNDASSEMLPLAAVFVLKKGADVKTDLMAPAQACMALVENAFRLDPSDPKCATDTLALAAGVVHAIPCARLAYPRHYDSLPAVRECVERALAGGSPPKRVTA